MSLDHIDSICLDSSCKVSSGLHISYGTAQLFGTWISDANRFKHSGNCVYHHVLGIKTLRVGHKMYVCVCFICLPHLTVIIFMHSINRLVFVMETDCVLWEVRTEVLNIILLKYSRQGGQSPVSYLRGTGAVLGHSVWNLWWKKCHCHRLLCQYFGFPLSVSFHQCSIPIHSTTTHAI